MDAATDATQGALADDLVQVEVILDIVPVRQVKLLRVKLDPMALVRVVIVAILHQRLEVLPRELDELFGLLAHDLLDEVLEDAREGVRDIDLLRGENPHLPHI